MQNDHAYFNSLGPYETNPVVAVGVSGGIDSLALTFMLNTWLKSINGKLVAITVNHNLRPEAAHEAKQIGELLRSHDIEHHTLNWQHGKVTSNIQEQAREARLALLTEYCREHNILHLMLAHHAGDVAETMLIKVCRGSGLNGLTGIQPINIINKTRVLRPLLSCSKAQLKKELAKYHNWWLEDPSNLNSEFMRSLARKVLCSNNLLQLVNVQTKKHQTLISRFGLLSKNLSRTRHYLETQIAHHMVQIVKIYPQGFLTIEYQQFIILDSEIGLSILANCLITISTTHAKRPRLDSLERVLQAIIAGKSKGLTLWDCKIKLSPGRNLIEITAERAKHTAFLPRTPLIQSITQE